jgi:hypothetical protein
LFPFPDVLVISDNDSPLLARFLPSDLAADHEEKMKPLQNLALSRNKANRQTVNRILEILSFCIYKNRRLLKSRALTAPLNRVILLAAKENPLCRTQAKTQRRCVMLK